MEDTQHLHTPQELRARRAVSRRRLRRQRVGAAIACALLALGVGMALLPVGQGARHLGLLAIGHKPHRAGSLDGIPPAMVGVYERAGDLSGVSWHLLAAIGQEESDHDRSDAPGVHSGLNEAGCCSGPAQICVVASCGKTWQHYSINVFGDRRPDVYAPSDAFTTAGRYLVALERDVGTSPRLLLAAYNAGPGAVLHYGGVPPYPETEEYVRRGMELVHALGGVG